MGVMDLHMCNPVAPRLPGSALKVPWWWVGWVPTYYQVKLQLMLRLSWAVTISFLVFTLIIQCFIVLKLIVFKGNIRTKSEPVVRLCFLPDSMILSFFRVKFVEKLSNGLIDIHLIVPPNYF